MAIQGKPDEGINLHPNGQSEASQQSGRRRRRRKNQNARTSAEAENNNWRCLSGKKVKIFFIIFFFITTIITGVVTGLICCRSGPTCCPPDWIGYQEKCYYYSKHEQNWTSSQDFCSSFRASLAVIDNPEMEFVMRYKGKDSFWIGLRRAPGQSWKWTSGDNSSLQVIGDGGDCAYLNEDASASSSRCSTKHHFLCSKRVTS
ncbi:C-type lectin domain family 2 member D-like [Varanus komodoensis]|uniref:C-type lectin domain family 2 member D-like n=1 Tax=Varanus komodoensis TaxID=61221 RepID=UPI001CF7B04C|nr:C-type lectin domain family 2 member D-like [Varanus komodoensis]XP_044285722.1 C-type lectin domain family 2 member D-like [Varanus komodoensis]